MYNGGLGWILRKQSEKKWIVRLAKSKGWLDQKRCPEVRKWVKKQLTSKMGKDYDFEVSLLAKTSSSVTKTLK